MVSKKLKGKVAVGKFRKAAGMVLPIFSKESPQEFVNQIMREDEDIRRAVMFNPKYKDLLEQEVVGAFKKYRGVLYGAKAMDSWDRVSSALGMAGSAIDLVAPGFGTAISEAEEVVESIPKGIYAIYYGLKTGDWKALPLWAGYEALSFIPYIGDAIDFTNIYINRARQLTKTKAKEEFRKKLKVSSLEQKLLSDNRPRVV